MQLVYFYVLCACNNWIFRLCVEMCASARVIVDQCDVICIIHGLLILIVLYCLKCNLGCKWCFLDTDRMRSLSQTLSPFRDVTLCLVGFVPLWSIARRVDESETAVCV